MGLGGEGLSETSFRLIGGVAANGELRVGAEEKGEDPGTDRRFALGGRPIPKLDIEEGVALGGGEADLFLVGKAGGVKLGGAS